MAITVAEVQILVQRHYPDISSAVFLDLFNQAHFEIVSAIRILPDLSTTIALTGGTAQYTLPDTTFHIHEAAIGSTSLLCSSIEELDDRNRNWRTAVATTTAPTSTYYLNASSIGLYPAPDATTALTPLTLWISQQPSALGSGDSLPGLIIVPNAWVYRVLAKFALMEHREDAQVMMQLSEQELGELHRYLQMRSPRLKTMQPPQAQGQPAKAGK